MIEEIAQILVDNGLGALGTDIFINNLPPSPDNAILILTEPSGEQDRDYDVRNLSIAFWVRDVNMASGFAKLQRVFDLLVRKENYDTANYHIYYGFAQSNVEFYQMDANKRTIHKLSIRFIYRPGGRIS